MSDTTPRREHVLRLVRDERTRQLQQYGTNDDLETWFGGTVPSYPWLSPFTQDGADEVEHMFRQDYELYVHVQGKPSWMHLIREEVAEMFEASSREDVIAETVQVAALCVSLVELLLGKEQSVTPKKYRKKPVEVEALQFVGGPESAALVVKWIMSGGGQAHYETVDMDTITGMIGIKTLEGQMWATPGDFVIKGVQGEFYPCKPDIFAQTYDRSAPPQVALSDENRRILQKAYDDGDGGGITLSPGEDPLWFVGTYDDTEVCEGVEHDGVLYTIVHLSGGGLVSVIVGRGLIDNEMGAAFHSVDEAKAYIQGRIEK